MDLIDRQQAIDKIKDWMKFIGYSHSERNVMECTIQMLTELPSAQKTGEQQPPYVAEIEEEYKKAVNAKWIRKPLAKALYEVWKKHDREDAERRTDE